MKLWVLIAAVLLTRAASVNSENPSPVDISFSLASFSEQLTQQSVAQSFQDSRGALWFVTQEGLNRYTGHELENYRYSLTVPGSLANDNVTRITEDLDGNLWISTFGGGLIYYDPITNSFEALYSDPNNRNSPYSNNIHTVYCDKDGVIWLGYSNGFSTFDPIKRNFRHYISGSNDIPYMGEIRDFTQTPDGALWAATQTVGLLRIAPSDHELSIYAHEKDKPGSIVSNSLYRIITDKQGNIWIASNDAGVSYYNPKEDFAVNFSHSESDTTSLSSNQTFDILKIKMEIYGSQPMKG